MTDLELNEAVARKLKGWCSNCKCTYPVESAHHNCPGEFGNCHHADNCNLPAYRTSIEAAWEIVDKIKETELFALCFHDGQWHCEINCCDGERPIDEEADTAPKAICLAFLKLEIEEDSNELPVRT